MKDKVLQLIERHISGMEDKDRRLRFSFGGPLEKEHGQSGETYKRMLAESEQALKEAHNMKAWFLGVVG